MTFLSNIDHLRPPSILDPQAALAKDWWHLNVFDHQHSAIGIINTSLHGNPPQGFGVAVGCTLFHDPVNGWCGGVEIREMALTSIDPTSIGLAYSAMSVRLDGTVDVSLRLPDVSGTFAAMPVGRRVQVEDRLPFGSGWISWRATPRMTVEGGLTVLGRTLHTSDLSAYHDHNWGRWRWGDDAGWEWATFVASDDGPTFVLAKTTDRHHRRGVRQLIVQLNGREWRFRDQNIRVIRDGTFTGKLLRVPGPMAALRSDRRRPALPAVVQVEAHDAAASLSLAFRANGAAQIICADPAGGSHGFVHELCGPMDYRFAVNGSCHEGTGLGVFEHVD